MNSKKELLWGLWVRPGISGLEPRGVWTLRSLGLARFRIYLDPKEPTFLGFLIMISLCKEITFLGLLIRTYLFWAPYYVFFI